MFRCQYDVGLHIGVCWRTYTSTDFVNVDLNNVSRKLAGCEKWHSGWPLYETFPDTVAEDGRVVINIFWVVIDPYYPSTLVLSLRMKTIKRLTHWSREKMAANIQTTFSNAFSWMKRHTFLLRIHWINNILSLVQIVAWRRPGDKPSFEPTMVRLPSHIFVTRPQWVKTTEHHNVTKLNKYWIHSTEQATNHI